MRSVKIGFNLWVNDSEYIRCKYLLISPDSFIECFPLKVLGAVQKQSLYAIKIIIECFPLKVLGAVQKQSLYAIKIIT